MYKYCQSAHDIMTVKQDKIASFVICFAKAGMQIILLIFTI